VAANPGDWGRIVTAWPDGQPFKNTADRDAGAEAAATALDRASENERTMPRYHLPSKNEQETPYSEKPAAKLVEVAPPNLFIALEVTEMRG